MEPRRWATRVCFLAALTTSPMLSAQPFLTYGFDDAGVSLRSDWVLPDTLFLCLYEPETGAPIPIPIGGPESGWEADGIGEGVLVCQNDSTDLDTNADGQPDTPIGIFVGSLRPTTVALRFDDPPRNYKMRARFFIEIDEDGLYSNEVIFSLRARVNVNELQFDAEHERSYTFNVFPQGVLHGSDFDFLPELEQFGAVSMFEWTSCHGPVDHPEWPGADPGRGANWGTAIPPFEIVPDEWHWIEASVQGNDDGGQVLLSVKIWPDGDLPPDEPLLRAWDLDGFEHNATTRDPNTHVELGIGTSWHLRASSLGNESVREQFGKRTLVDDVSFTTLAGCSEPPARVTRSMSGESARVEGEPARLFSDNAATEVTLTFTDDRAGGTCDAVGLVDVVETVPGGWDIVEISDGGTYDSSSRAVKWTVDLTASGAGAGASTRCYSIAPTPSAQRTAELDGEYHEPASEFAFRVGGESTLVDSDAVPGVSATGTILHWLLLGPYEQCGGAAPGSELMRRDYLTDGKAIESTVRPAAGDTIATRFRTVDTGNGELCTDPQEPGEAASTGLAADAHERNPTGLPAWLDWQVIDDDPFTDDTVDANEVYGDINDMMFIGLTYLDVEDDTTVNFGVGSDDAVQVLLDGQEIHLNNVARGVGGGYPDNPSNFPQLGDVDLSAGQHVLVVKVFEGGGGHGFRIGFVDELGAGTMGAPEGVDVSREYRPPQTSNRFVRGDCNNDGVDNISDPIFNLIFQFSGDGEAPDCLEACDINGDQKLNITDPIFQLSFLFQGGPAPPAPYPACDSAQDAKCALDTCG